jgi:hypothetical protein
LLDFIVVRFLRQIPNNGRFQSAEVCTAPLKLDHQTRFLKA